MFSYTLRTFRDGDAAQVNELALAAFDQFRSEYSDWPAMTSAIGQMCALTDTGEIIEYCWRARKSYRAQSYNKISLAQLHCRCLSTMTFTCVQVLSE